MDGVNKKVRDGRDGEKICILRVQGYLDIVSARELGMILDRSFDEGMVRIVVDLEAVGFVGSMAWGVFLSKIKKFRDAGGDIKLACMNPEVLEVYKILEFFWFMRSYDSLAAAVQDFQNNIPPMPPLPD
ncbi:MAG TPA: STAS domain-containing protein [Bacteroidetes bacterium]|nr:STAS domain-containing protein [Bacteroidota bacterium]